MLATAAGIVVNVVCQWASMRPGIRVFPAPSIWRPPGSPGPAGRTEAIVPSVTVTSNGPSTRPAMLSNTLTFVMRSGSCSTIRAFP